MTIKYFGKIAELTNVATEQWPVSNKTVADFKDSLMDKYPQLANETINIAVNLRVESGDFRLNDSDEIAIMPPFAGG